MSKVFLYPFESASYFKEHLSLYISCMLLFSVFFTCRLTSWIGYSVSLLIWSCPYNIYYPLLNRGSHNDVRCWGEPGLLVDGFITEMYMIYIDLHVYHEVPRSNHTSTHPFDLHARARNKKTLRHQHTVKHLFILNCAGNLLFGLFGQWMKKNGGIHFLCDERKQTWNLTYTDGNEEEEHV